MKSFHASWALVLVTCLGSSAAHAHDTAELARLDTVLESAELDETVIDALIERAALSRMRGDFGASLADLNEAYTLDPEHPEIALQRGLVLALLGFKKDAEHDLEAVERAFGSLASAGRDTDRATSLLKTLIAATPPPPAQEDTDGDPWADVEHPDDAAAQLDAARAALREARR